VVIPARWVGQDGWQWALAKTYAWLNPTAGVGAVSAEQRDFGVFDRLWRLQVLDAAGQWRNPGTELPLAVAELRRSLTGLADPAAGLRFINTLVQAASEVKDWADDIKDGWFLRALLGNRLSHSDMMKP
jgi:hypothetical protein